MNEKIEFKLLDYECIDKDTVTFRLEDDTIVKVKIDLERVGIALNYKNPDGTAHYLVNTSVKVKIIPSDRRFSLERRVVNNTHIT